MRSTHRHERAAVLLQVTQETILPGENLPTFRASNLAHPKVDDGDMSGQAVEHIAQFRITFPAFAILPWTKKLISRLLGSCEITKWWALMCSSTAWAGFLVKSLLTNQPGHVPPKKQGTRRASPDTSERR